MYNDSTVTWDIAQLYSVHNHLDHVDRKEKRTESDETFEWKENK